MIHLLLSIMQDKYIIYLTLENANQRMVIKTKARDQLEVEKVSDEAYQLDDPIPSRLVVNTDIPSNLLFASREVDVIDLSHQHSMTIIEDTKDK